MQEPILSAGLRRSALALSVALALNTGAALAQSPEETAARAIVDRILGNYTSMVPEMRFEFERNYTLAETDDGYETTLPVFDLIVDDTRISFGPVSFAVAPTEDSETEYTVDLQLGDAITIKEGETVLANVTIGEQSNQCIWDTELEACTEATGRLAQLKLEIPNNPMQASLASLDYGQTLTVGDSGEWQSEQELALAALQVSAEGTELKLGQLAGAFTMDGSDFEQMQNLAEKMQQLVQENADKLSQDDPEATAAMLQSVGDIYATFTGFDSSLIAENLQITQGGQALGGADRLEMGAHYTVEGEAANAGYAIEYAGLQTAMAPLPPNLMPSEARIAIDVVNLPPNMFQQFVAMGLESEKLAEEEQEAFWNQKMMELFMGNQIGLEITDTYVAAQDARVDLGLEAYANPESALGGTGAFLLKITGMQTVIDTLGLANDENVAPVLAMLTAFSNRTEAEGKVVDTFDLKLSADGKLLLNSKDVTAMFMPGAGAAPDAAATPDAAAPEESAPEAEAAPANPSGKGQ